MELLHNDGGTMRLTTAATFKTYFQEGISTAYDDLTTGDAAVNIATSAGNITIDAQGNDTDIIFKGTDGGADRTFMTIDGSAGGDLFLTGGLIDLKNDGSAVSQIKFYCESSNAHAQTLQGAPHSESATNALTLPSTGGSADLVSTSSSSNLTNKTLTSPIINTGTFGTSILPTSADGTTLGSASKEFSDLFLADASTIQFGNDQDVTLTHVADAGIMLNTTMQLRFRDSAISIGSPADGDLDINADDEIELNSTLIDVNGNLDVSGTIVGASTLTGVTQITVDDIDLNGKVITMTGSSGDTFVTTVAANGATSLVTTDAAAAAANFSITADGTVDIDSAGVLTLDSGAAINIEPAAGSAILLDGTISVDAGVVTGATSVTSTAFVGNLTGTVATATQNSITTATGLVSVGALDSGSITSGFGAIDNGTSNIRSATITAETAFVPDASDGAALGTSSLEFSDLFLADGAVINFGDDQDVTLTHAADVGLTLVGKLTIDQDDADIALRIEQAGDERGIFIDQNGNDAALNIDSETTTAEGIIVDCSALTTGKALMVNSNSASSATRQLVRITNDHASATGTTNLYVDNDSDGFVADFHGTAGIRSAAGISFGTDTAAANRLDDYEEGTYAVVVTGATSGSFTMSTENVLAYTKVGRLISIQGTIGVQSGSVSGNVRMSLPFAPTELADDAEIGRPSLFLSNTGNTNAGQTFLQLSPDGSAYFTKVSDAGSFATITNSDVDGTFEVGVSFTYISG